MKIYSILFAKEKAESVSGGIKNVKLKFVTLALLGLTIAPISMSNIVSAKLPKFYCDIVPFYSNYSKKYVQTYCIIKPQFTKNGEVCSTQYIREVHNAFLSRLENPNDLSIVKILNKYKNFPENELDSDFMTFLNCLYNKKIFGRTVPLKLTLEEKNEIKKRFYQTDCGKNALTKRYYKSIYDNIIEKALKSDEFVNESHEIEIGNDKKCILSPERFKHIIFGKFDKDLAYHISGGHTIQAIKLIEAVNEAKLKECDENPKVEQYKENVLKGKIDPYEIVNGRYRFLDSVFAISPREQDKEYQYKSILPVSWTSKDIFEAIKLVLREGKEIKNPGNKYRDFVGIVNGIVVNVRTDLNIDNVDSIFQLSVPSSEFESFYDKNKVVH